MLYSFISFISFIIRYLICYFTIDSFPIFESEASQTLWSAIFGGVIYAILRLICYPIVGVISRKYNVQSSAIRSALYFVLYLPLVGITYAILLFLTHLEILPIQLQSITLQSASVWIVEKIGAFCQFIVSVISFIIS